METFNNSQRKILLDQLEKRLVQIDQQKAELDKEKSEITQMIKGLKSSEADTSTPGKRKSLLKGQNFTWKTISLDILKSKRRIVNTDEVYNEFSVLKPEFREHNQKNIQASFSSALSQLSDQGEIVRIEQKMSRANLWALPEWFQPDGTPYREFREQLESYHLEDFRAPTREVTNEELEDWPNVKHYKLKI